MTGHGQAKCSRRLPLQHLIAVVLVGVMLFRKSLRLRFFKYM